MARDLTYIRLGGKVELPRGVELPIGTIDIAVARTNLLFEELYGVAPYVFALLDMRNLSAFVGEAFAAELVLASDGLLVANPHQDGYPDLLLMDADGREVWSTLASLMRDKAPFSPFPTGGLEIKATCGDVPTEAALQRRGRTKPVIGEPRVDIVSGLNWKSHHQDTNNLMGIVWDFVDQLPAIVAVTYRGDLTTQDWGNIVQPRAGGGRTTSVSIMNAHGVGKMFANTVVALDGDHLALVQRFRDRAQSRARRASPATDRLL